ncbi:hypothetical protein GGR56DRAFT_607394 [Xylariaceae sp. FL0804]|nr:hypothetical protein GGR56DRAFT_607394 [Xylariaceae sp. FL0804]
MRWTHTALTSPYLTLPSLPPAELRPAPRLGPPTRGSPRQPSDLRSVHLGGGFHHSQDGVPTKFPSEPPPRKSSSAPRTQQRRGTYLGTRGAEGLLLKRRRAEKIKEQRKKRATRQPMGLAPSDRDFQLTTTGDLAPRPPELRCQPIRSASIDNLGSGEEEGSRGNSNQKVCVYMREREREREREAKEHDTSGDHGLAT